MVVPGWGYIFKNLTKYGHFTPEIRAEWRHEFLDEMNDITASMEGVPGYSFTVSLPPVDTDFAIFGGVLTASLGERMEAIAMYQELIRPSCQCLPIDKFLACKAGKKSPLATKPGKPVNSGIRL